MAVLDAQGTVTGWSEGARLLTGHPADEVVGRPAAGLLRRGRPRRPPRRPHRPGRPAPPRRPPHRAAPHRVPAHRHRRTARRLRRHGHGRRCHPGRPGLPAGVHVHVRLRPPAALPARQRGRLPCDGRPRGGAARPVLPGHRRERRAQPRLPDPTAPGRRDRPAGPLRGFTDAPAQNREHAWSIEMWPLPRWLRRTHHGRPRRVRQQRAVLGGAASPC
ncbi:PAS domain-containing protein [Streptomyces tricolor]|nr:PAS domain-containing protein [Streptomyces tricolor]